MPDTTAIREPDISSLSPRIDLGGVEQIQHAW